jgi:hypothetical protein
MRWWRQREFKPRIYTYHEIEMNIGITAQVLCYCSNDCAGKPELQWFLQKQTNAACKVFRPSCAVTNH